MTRSQLDRERDRQQETLDALNRASQRTTKVTAQRRAGCCDWSWWGGRLRSAPGPAATVTSRSAAGRPR